MRELSQGDQEIIDLLDTQIEVINKKLGPFQSLIDQRNRLRKAKNVLLQERATVSSSSLTVESVKQAFSKLPTRYAKPADLAPLLGVTDSAVRSHLHRHMDEAYKQKGDKWRVIGDTPTSE